MSDRDFLREYEDGNGAMTLKGWPDRLLREHAVLAAMRQAVALERIADAAEVMVAWMQADMDPHGVADAREGEEEGS